MKPLKNKISITIDSDILEKIKEKAGVDNFEQAFVQIVKGERNENADIY